MSERDAKLKELALRKYADEIRRFRELEQDPAADAKKLGIRRKERAARYEDREDKPDWDRITAWPHRGKLRGIGRKMFKR